MQTRSLLKGNTVSPQRPERLHDRHPKTELEETAGLHLTWLGTNRLETARVRGRKDDFGTVFGSVISRGRPRHDF